MCYGGIATFGWPVARFAQVPGRGRLVFVLLRGGFDGLAAVVPVGDPDYERVRGPMAFAADEVSPLEGGFALAPGLAPWKTLWDDNQLVALHAMAIPLTGVHPVTTWSPATLGVVDDAYLDRLGILYRADGRLHDRFEAALQMRDTAPEMGGGRGRGPGQVAAIMRATARFLAEPDGPNVAALEFSGWDTHANQGMRGGALDQLLGRLAEGVLTLRAELGATWRETTVVIMTEFGRTARPNGTQGTDHGTAGAGFVIGPPVSGSAVVSDWPGLAERALFQGRDLEPTLDTRAVLKGVVAGAFDLTAAQVDRVFPGSEGVRGLVDLMS
jgi:uncharacterized protein (DUF1501 family)